MDSTASITRSEEYVQSGNINSAIAVGDSVTDSNTIYDSNGNEYTLSVTYTKTAADEYDMTYELTDADGNVVADNGATALAVVFDNTTGDVATVNGAAAAAINIVEPTLGIDFNFDMTEITQTSNSTTVSSTVDDNRDATIVTGTVSIFDSLGNSHTLTVKFTKTSSNNWNWTADIPNSSGTLSQNSGTISFNSDGSVDSISPNPPVVTFAPTGGAQAENITLNFGSGFDGITQTSADSVLSALSQNGSAAASLSNLSIDQYGYIVGVFSNGQSKQLAQIMMATFPNLNGLTSVGENMYTVSANSGNPLIGEPGESTGTTIQSGALEQSNVDLSEEFTRMIVSQRGFQANARVVTTSDNLLQEITNLVR